MSLLKPNLQYETRSGNNWTAALSCEMHCQWHSTNLKGCHFIPDQILFGLSKYSRAFSKGLESRVVPHLKNDQAVVQTLWKLCLTFAFCFFLVNPTLLWLCQIPVAKGYMHGIYFGVRAALHRNSPLFLSPFCFNRSGAEEEFLFPLLSTSTKSARKGEEKQCEIL